MGGPSLIATCSRLLCQIELARSEHVAIIASFQMMCVSRLLIYLVKSYASEEVRPNGPEIMILWCEALSSLFRALRGFPWSYGRVTQHDPQNDPFGQRQLHDSDLDHESIL